MKTHNLSDTTKGFLLMGAGLLLLLNTMGIIQAGLNVVIGLGALTLMLIGFMKVNGPEFVSALAAKVSKKRD